MTNIFVQGLEQIRKGSSELSAETMFALFRTIEDMDGANLAAAKRTLDLFRSINSVGDSENAILDKINEIMIVQAQRNSVSEPTRYALLFQSAFGDDCYQKRIKKK